MPGLPGRSSQTPQWRSEHQALPVSHPRTWPLAAETCLSSRLLSWFPRGAAIWETPATTRPVPHGPGNPGAPPPAQQVAVHQKQTERNPTQKASSLCKRTTRRGFAVSRPLPPRQVACPTLCPLRRDELGPRPCCPTCVSPQIRVSHRPVESSSSVRTSSAEVANFL